MSIPEFSSIKPVTIRAMVTLTQEMLGTVPKNPDLFKAYIASRAPEIPEDEIELVELATEEGEDEVEIGETGFFTLDGLPCVADYQIKGAVKDWAKMLRRIDGSAWKGVSAYRQVIDGLVNAYPRFTPMILPEGCRIESISRPLRASTAKGERIAIATSDMVPIGTKFEFDIVWLSPTITSGRKTTKVEVLWQELVEYAAFRGFGQWRNAGHGRADIEWMVL